MPNILGALSAIASSVFRRSEKIPFCREEYEQTLFALNAAIEAAEFNTATGHLKNLSVWAEREEVFTAILAGIDAVASREGGLNSALWTLKSMGAGALAPNAGSYGKVDEKWLELRDRSLSAPMTSWDAAKILSSDIRYLPDDSSLAAPVLDRWNAAIDAIPNKGWPCIWMIGDSLDASLRGEGVNTRFRAAAYNKLLEQGKDNAGSVLTCLHRLYKGSNFSNMFDGCGAETKQSVAGFIADHLKDEGNTLSPMEKADMAVLALGQGQGLDSRKLVTLANEVLDWAKASGEKSDLYEALGNYEYLIRQDMPEIGAEQSVAAISALVLIRDRDLTDGGYTTAMNCAIKILSFAENREDYELAYMAMGVIAGCAEKWRNISSAQSEVYMGLRAVLNSSLTDESRAGKPEKLLREQMDHDVSSPDYKNSDFAASHIANLVDFASMNGYFDLADYAAEKWKEQVLSMTANARHYVSCWVLGIDGKSDTLHEAAREVFPELENRETTKNSVSRMDTQSFLQRYSPPAPHA